MDRNVATLHEDPEDASAALQPESQDRAAIESITIPARVTAAGITPDMIKAAAECGSRIYQNGSQVAIIPPDRPYMPAPYEHISRSLRFFFGAVILLAILFVLGGVGLVLLGGDGTTNFRFFDQEFSSKNAGIAAIFIGGVMVVLLLRRILATLDKTIDRDPRDKT